MITNSIKMMMMWIKKFIVENKNTESSYNFQYLIISMKSFHL